MLPSVALEVIAPESAKRHNKRIKAGNPERMVVELRQGQTLPPVHISAIICTIPCAERVRFNAQLKQVVYDTTYDMWQSQKSNADNVTYEQLETYMWSVCSFRYAYIGTPGALSTDFGAVWDQLPKCIILPTIHFTAVLFYLHELTSHDNKRQKLATIVPSMLPRAMRQFVQSLVPNIDEFWDKRAKHSDPNAHVLDLIPVHKWGPVSSVDESYDTSHLFQSQQNDWIKQQ
jgi:hypothetical protein